MLDRPAGALIRPVIDRPARGLARVRRCRRAQRCRPGRGLGRSSGHRLAGAAAAGCDPDPGVAPDRRAGRRRGAYPRCQRPRRLSRYQPGLLVLPRHSAGLRAGRSGAQCAGRCGAAGRFCRHGHGRPGLCRHRCQACTAQRGLPEQIVLLSWRTDRVHRDPVLLCRHVHVAGAVRAAGLSFRGDVHDDHRHPPGLGLARLRAAQPPRDTR